MPYKEVVIELTDGQPVTPLFQALVADPRALARLQGVGFGPDLVSVLVDYAGPTSAVERLRGIVRDCAEVTVLQYDTLVDDTEELRFVVTWRRPENTFQGVSLEHILHDTAGPGGLLFGRVENGTLRYKAASPGGHGLAEFVERVRAGFAGRFTVRTLRTGPFRPGWEIDDAPRHVAPSDTVLLNAALAAGYYDEPKRCGVRELGRVMGLSKSVVARRLRTLERLALLRLVG